LDGTQVNWTVQSTTNSTRDDCLREAYTHEAFPTAGLVLLGVNSMFSSATRLRVLRTEREWSQARLVVEVGVTRQTINSIEKRTFNPNLRLAFKIARAFGKLIEEVFIYEDI